MPRLSCLVEAARLVSAEPAPRDAYPMYLMFVRVEEQLDEPKGWTIEMLQCEQERAWQA